jgi:TolB-like protein
MKKRALFSIVALCFSLVSSFAQQKPTIAVLELGSSSAVDTSELGALTTRLRTELFETQKYTVVERSEMNAVLKEQGFQQTGCTDAACAVQVGQLLNAEYMIVGTVDKVGRLYSVNIRQVNVATGAISNNVKSDCVDCTIEDVMLKVVRVAAQRIAGIDSSKETEAMTKLKDRNLIKYKNDTGGETGSLSVIVIPSEAEVFIDGISHGHGSMVVDSLPVGRHKVTVASKEKYPVTKKVVIAYNKVTECKIKTTSFRHGFEPGISMMYPRLFASDKFTFVRDSGGLSDTLTCTVEDQWLPVSYSISQFHRSRHHVIGIGFHINPFLLNDQIKTTTDSSGNRFEYRNAKAEFGLFLEYYYTVLTIRNILITDIGIQCGGDGIILRNNPDHAIRADGAYFLNSTPDTPLFRQVFFVGPSINVLCGRDRIYFKVTYAAIFGLSPLNHHFANQLGASVLFQ